MALNAQKKERERYKRMLELALQHTDGESSQQEYAPSAGLRQLESDPAKVAQDDANDIFKHTFVDVPDAPESEKPEGRSDHHNPRQRDVFYFYNFSFDLPPEYYKQLGDFSLVNPAQLEAMKDLLLQQWPVLKGRQVQFRAAFDAMAQVFNVVLLGKDCPLSKCCKMTIYFQFTKDIGGRVICMESLCALNPLDHFHISTELSCTLFENAAMYSINDGAGLLSTRDSQWRQQNLTHAQYQKLKPTLKKIISQEISKLVSRGGHANTSLR